MKNRDLRINGWFSPHTKGLSVLNTVEIHLLKCSSWIPDEDIKYKMALHRYDAKEGIFEADWLFLCEEDHIPIIAGDMKVWTKHGNYEMATDYCDSKGSKSG